MNVLMDDNGHYVSATIRVIENGIVRIINETNQINIQQYLHIFANKFGVPLSYLSQTGYVNFSYLPKQHDYYVHEQKERKSLPRLDRSLVKKVISIAAVGVIAVSGINALSNYRLKKENAYNNKYVTLCYEAPYGTKIEGEMFDLLGNYDEFDQMMTSIANEEWSKLEGANLNKFWSNLGLVLHSNDEFIENFYLRGKRYDGAKYASNLEEYFVNSPCDYAAIKHFDLYYRMVSSDAYQEKRTDLNQSLRAYIEEICKFAFDDDYFIGIDANNNKQYFGAYNLSPLARYIILKTSLPIIEMTDFKYDTFWYKHHTKEDILKRVRNQLLYAEEQIIDKFETVNKKSNSR